MVDEDPYSLRLYVAMAFSRQDSKRKGDWLRRGLCPSGTEEFPSVTTSDIKDFSPAMTASLLAEVLVSA